MITFLQKVTRKRENPARFHGPARIPGRNALLLLTLLALVFLAWRPAPIPTSRIEIYYFHFTKRSQTSLNIENVTRNAMLSLYPVKVKRGEIMFKCVNLDEKDGKDLGAKFNIKKTSLVVILLADRVDITKQANKYADKQPDKLTEEIKKAVETLLQHERDAQKP